MRSRLASGALVAPAIATMESDKYPVMRFELVDLTLRRADEAVRGA